MFETCSVSNSRAEIYVAEGLFNAHATLLRAAASKRLARWLPAHPPPLPLPLQRSAAVGLPVAHRCMQSGPGRSIPGLAAGLTQQTCSSGRGRPQRLGAPCSVARGQTAAVTRATQAIGSESGAQCGWNPTPWAPLGTAFLRHFCDPSKVTQTLIWQTPKALSTGVNSTRLLRPALVPGKAHRTAAASA